MGVVSDTCCGHECDFREVWLIYSYESMVSTIVLAGTVDNDGPYGLGKWV